MSTLSAKKLAEIVAEIERKCGPSPARMGAFLGDYMRDGFAGMKVFEAPESPPKIELRDITLSDGTKLFTPEFRAETNLWLLEQFGRREELRMLKTHFFTFGDMLIGSKENVGRLFQIGNIA